MEELRSIFDHISTFFAEAGDTLALLALLTTIVIFLFQQRRANRIEKQENYLTLELASNDLFRFEGENAARLEPFKAAEFDAADDNISDGGLADAFYFMTLNLFEISIRLRQEKTIKPEVFGSWVVWYYDTLTSGYFRQNWLDYRDNYTAELKQIFDPMVASYDPARGESYCRKAFFDHVAKVLKCPIIKDWLNTAPNEKSASRRVQPSAPELSSQWVKVSADTAAEYGTFLAQNISGDTSYISHSEFFEGLSPDGKNWAKDVKARLIAGLKEPREGDLWALELRSAGGELAALGLMEIGSNGAQSYGEIEDMSVAKTYRRLGLGRRLMREMEAKAKALGAQKLILESGLDNHGAHKLFDAAGFEVMSKVFVKEI